ncbi:sensor domain-containing phosphodiesterase [Salidesulfovibrio onnuriiensis]|uniref:sensor domain-containing phosphodiesterase n=1 Tax=Salidesulfovibrio onnuriiensis TaxID=2583823 RepID=UPI0011C89B1F|nr:EAL domain-containing protein [Salidesulfovibrio onnuriiensis]
MKDPQVVGGDSKVAAGVSPENIITLFQPIVSIPTRGIIGFESFSEGREPETGKSIEAIRLVESFPDPDLQLKVDRQCRERALEQFKPILAQHKAMLLFLWLNVGILSNKKADPLFLEKQVEQVGIPPKNVCIELPVSVAVKMPPKVLEHYRAKGYGLCIIDLSTSDAFLEAFVRLRPNFVKLGRSFYTGPEKRYRAKMLDGLLDLSETVGFSVIGQGVEQQQESIGLLRSRVFLQQGTYYVKDKPEEKYSAKGEDPVKMFYGKIVETFRLFRENRRKEILARKSTFETLQQEVRRYISRLCNEHEPVMEVVLASLFRNRDRAISMFVLNKNGIQVTGRLHVKSPRGEVCHRPPRGEAKGMDHSMRDYFLYIEMGYDRFVTRPFVSPYTEEEVVIIALPFYNAEDRMFVLCVEMPYPY